MIPCGERDTLVSRTLGNALVGAVVSVVLFLVPLSPALGGAVAGYLGRGDAVEGATVGSLSGAIAAVPGTVVGVLLAAVFVVAPPDGGLGFLAAGPSPTRRGPTTRGNVSRSAFASSVSPQPN